MRLQSLKRQTIQKSQKTCESQQSQRHEAEIQMTKTMWLIIISYLVCWMPVTVSFITVAITRKRHFFFEYNELFGMVFHIVAVIATHLNSVIDSVIYAYRIKEVRDEIKKMFQCRVLLRNRNQESSVTNESALTKNVVSLS